MEDKLRSAGHPAIASQSLDEDIRPMYSGKQIRFRASTKRPVYPEYALLIMVKLCRAQGGCLGTESR